MTKMQIQLCCIRMICSNPNDNSFTFQVWPGTTVFPDFFDDDTIKWWKNNAEVYHNDIPFDGMWIVSCFYHNSSFL